MDTTPKHYDYIIAGGGMAGLSLAYYLCKSKLWHKKILIIDREQKTKNDRTWGFWQKGEGAFDEILWKKWKNIEILGPKLHKKVALREYEYHMIRGIDFYEFVLRAIKQNPNITFVYAEIERITEEAVITKEGVFEAEWVFDSTYQLNLNLSQYSNLLQHFKGWVVKSPQPVFNPERPTVMDFRVEQVEGFCTFFYVLPYSETEALVEYTLFSPALLPPTHYNIALEDYLLKFLQMTDYEVIHEEFGVIPMTNEPTPEHPEHSVIRIGTSGGYAKPSSGYTFTRTQKYLQEIVRNLEDFGEPFRWKELLKNRYRWLDKVFLNVLLHQRVPPSEVFLTLYEKNDADWVFKFLDEESTLSEDISMMTTLPMIPFLKAAFS